MFSRSTRKPSQNAPQAAPRVITSPAMPSPQASPITHPTPIVGRIETVYRRNVLAFQGKRLDGELLHYYVCRACAMRIESAARASGVYQRYADFTADWYPLTMADIIAGRSGGICAACGDNIYRAACWQLGT